VAARSAGVRLCGVASAEGSRTTLLCGLYSIGDRRDGRFMEDLSRPEPW